MGGVLYEVALVLFQTVLGVALVCLIIDVINVADYRRALRSVRGCVEWGRGEASVVEALNKRMHGFVMLYYRVMFSGVAIGGVGLASDDVLIKVVWCAFGLCLFVYGWCMQYKPGEIVRESEKLLKSIQNERAS